MATISQVKNIAYRMVFEDAGFTAGMNAAAAAAAKVGPAGATAAAGVAKVTKEVAEAGPAWSTLSTRVDGNLKLLAATEAANRKLEASMASLRARAARDPEVAAKAAEYEKVLLVQRDAAISKAQKQAEAIGVATAATDRSTASTRQFSQSVGQAGFQLQDFAVQVQAGTSYLTALSQQGSQFLGIFGPAGAMAGAALVVGILAAQLLGLAGTAKTLDDVLEDNAANYDRVTAAAEARINGLKAEAEAVELLRTSYAAMGEAGARAEAIRLTQANNALQTQAFDLQNRLGANLAPRLERRDGLQQGFDPLGNALGGLVQSGVTERFSRDIEQAMTAFEALRNAGTLTSDSLRTYISALDDAARAGGGNTREVYALRDAALAALGQVGELEKAFRQNAVQAVAMRLAAGESAEAIIASSNAASNSAAGFARVTAEIVRTGQALNALRQRAIDDPMAEANAETVRLMQQLEALNRGGEAAYTQIRTAQEAQTKATERATAMQTAFVAKLVESGVEAGEATQRGIEMGPAFVAAATRAAEAQRTVTLRLDEVKKAAQEASKAATAGTRDAAQLAARIQRDTNTLVGDMDKFWDAADKRAEARATTSAAAVKSQEDALELARREGDLLTANGATRDRELAVLRERQKLQPGEEGTTAGQRRLALAAEAADTATALARQKDAYAEIQKIGTQAFERIGGAITEAFAQGKISAINFGSIAKAMLSEVVQAVLRLAVLRPVMNALFGSNYATISDVGGLAGGMLGTSGGSAGTSGGGVSLTDTASLGFKAYNQFSGTSATGGATSGYTGAVSNWLSSPAYTVGGEGASYGASAVADAGWGVTTANPGTAVSYGSAIGGGLAVAGGAYAAYEGVKRGGPGGYTSAAGGAVSAASGLAMLGAFGPGLMAAGPYGLIAAAIIMAIGAMLPGQKPSNRVGASIVDLESRSQTEFGATGDKFSSENRAAATNLIDRLEQMADAFEGLTGYRPRGVLTTNVGDRDGLRLDYSTAQRQFGARNFSADEAGEKELFRQAAVMFMEASFEQWAPAVRAAFRGVQQDSAENILTGLAKIAEATGGGKPTANQAIAAERIDFSNLDAGLGELRWVRDVYEALLKPTEAAGSFATALADVAKSWQDAIDHANRLGLATDVLSQKYSDATVELYANRGKMLDDLTSNLTSRVLRARGQNKEADLFDFDRNSGKERDALAATLKDWGIVGEEAAYRLTLLETVLGDERLAIVKRYGDAINGVTEDQMKAAQQSATGIVTNLANYARGLRTRSDSPLSATAQYSGASREFDAVLGAAQAGDGNSIAQLTGFADTLLATSRAVNGSGAGFASDFARVIEAIGSIAGKTADELTASILQAEMRTQTATLVGELVKLQTEVGNLRRELALNAAVPAVAA